MSVLTERVRLEYDESTLEDINISSDIILLQFRQLKKSGTSVIYPNQEELASKIVNSFKDRRICNTMNIGRTQSGKTGIMCATIRIMLADSKNPIDPNNIYIITGLSSIEWIQQTKMRMPEALHSRVFHRNQLPETFVDEIRGKENILIIMDEVQVAAKKNQTIANAFLKAGLLNSQYLYENDIKIIEFTATPDGTIYSLMDRSPQTCKIIGDPGRGYVGCYDLFLAGRVLQYKDLCGYDKSTGVINPIVYDNIRELKKVIDSFSKPLYHVIRTKKGSDQEITVSNLKKIFGVDSYEYRTYDGFSSKLAKDSNINEILSVTPKKHTFILVMEKLRCAVTVRKDCLGVLYERFTLTPDDAGIIQGLSGRATGYDDNGFSITFTNIDTIERYQALWNCEFNDKSIVWRSKTTKYINGTIVHSANFNDAEPTSDVSSDSDESDDSIKVVCKEFATFDEVLHYYKSELKGKIKGRGPCARKVSDGFYIGTIRQLKGILKYDDVIVIQKKFGLNGNSKFRVTPCYKDTENPSTLVWVMTHY